MVEVRALIQGFGVENEPGGNSNSQSRVSVLWDALEQSARLKNLIHHGVGLRRVCGDRPSGPCPGAVQGAPTFPTGGWERG